MNVKQESALADLVSSNDHQSFVSFKLYQQTYAFPIEPIVQIIEMVTITAIPQVNPIVEGIINVRGAAVPVINLRRHLGLPEMPLQLHTPIVLVVTHGQTVGLLVDEVLDVLNISGQRVARTVDILPRGLGDSPILQGLIHTAEGIVLLLDVEHLFSPGQARVLAQALDEFVEGDAGEEDAN